MTRFTVSWASLHSYAVRVKNSSGSSRVEVTSPLLDPQPLLDLQISSLLFAVALAVRLPYLTLIPRYVDEGVDTLWALDIALGRHLPLTAVDTYNGPLTAYLMAAAFSLFGVNAVLPRLVIAIGGATLVVAVYGLTQRLAGRSAGLMAASLTLVHPILVTHTSHQAFSAGLTPLFAIITLWAGWETVQQRSVVWAGVTGWLAALTVQTHPTSAAGLVGLALWLVAQSRWWPAPRPSAFVAGAGLFLIGYAPMLAANLYPDSSMLGEAYARSYAFNPVASLPNYITRVISMTRFFLYAVGGALPPGAWWMRLMSGLTAVLLLGALIYLWRRGLTVVPLVFITSALLLPLVVHSQTSRYLGGLIPLAHVGLGIAGAALLASSKLARLSVVSVWGVLVSLAMATIGLHYQDAWANGWTNAGYAELATTLKQQDACGGGLWLAQAKLDYNDLPESNVDTVLHALHYHLTLERCSHNLAPLAEERALAHATSARWLILPTLEAGIVMAGWQPVTTVTLPRQDARLMHVTLYGRRLSGAAQ